MCRFVTETQRVRVVKLRIEGAGTVTARPALNVTLTRETRRVFPLSLFRCWCRLDGLPATGTARPSGDGEVAATNLASDVDKRTMRWHDHGPARPIDSHPPPDGMDMWMDPSSSPCLAPARPRCPGGSVAGRRTRVLPRGVNHHRPMPVRLY